MNAYLMPALKFTPGLIAQKFESLSTHAVDQPTHPDRFTPREVLAHLADWEPIMLSRMKQTVNDPGSTIQPFDEGQMAIDNGYSTTDAKTSLDQFSKARQETIAWLTTLSSQDWKKAAVHPERGELTVYDWANMLVCHDVYHLEQLSQPN